MRKFLCVFLFSYGASQRRPCVRIGQTHAYLSHVKMTLAKAKSVNRQTLENVVRNAASEFTRRTAIASLASLRLRMWQLGALSFWCFGLAVQEHCSEGLSKSLGESRFEPFKSKTIPQRYIEDHNMHILEHLVQEGHACPQYFRDQRTRVMLVRRFDIQDYSLSLSLVLSHLCLCVSSMPGKMTLCVTSSGFY